MLENALQRIAAQQGKENTPIWMVGEQLKDICRNEPRSAELVAQDLDIPEMSLANCEKKIKAYADSHRQGNFACVIPSVAEKIIREFYGLTAKPPAQSTNTVISLLDLL
ncbi:hypothetical protein RBH76_10610 [Oscillospiraceae bacterium MB24-C1]|nr:hypothetical protein RBH76_10610 [Oscillospiraceae bacterium MB24-C1]